MTEQLPLAAEVSFFVRLDVDKIKDRPLASWQAAFTQHTDVELPTWDNVYEMIACDFLAGGDYTGYVLDHGSAVDVYEDPEPRFPVADTENGPGLGDRSDGIPSDLGRHIWTAGDTDAEPV